MSEASAPNAKASDPYTPYVQSLSPSGEPPDVVSYDRVCRQLAKDLRKGIRRRGLLDASPTFFGVAGDRWDRETLDELACDAYVPIFIDRLRGLRNQLKKKPNLRGLVLRNLNNYLTERQMKADPIGYRAFDRVREAVKRAVERGELHLANTRELTASTLLNDTVLGFGETFEPLASSELLAVYAVPWNDELLPELVTAMSKTVPIVIERLADRIVTLEDSGVTAFRLGDLVDVIKKDIRRRWHDAVYPSELGFEGDADDAVQVPIVDPRLTRDASDFAALVECVKRTISGLDDKARTQRELYTLFAFMRDFSEDGKKRPSNVKIGELLGMSRERVPVLLTRLGQFIERCLAGREGGAL